jgi:hypothetical protein
MTTLNKGYFGTIAAVGFNKDTNSIEVVMHQLNGVARLMRHKVGAQQGISKEESKQLWFDLHNAMDAGESVVFMYRGSWKSFFDKFEVIEENADESFAQMIGIDA